MKKISIKKAIFLGMASFLDEAVDWWEVANSRYICLTYARNKKHSIHNVISNLLKTGYLEKRIKENGEAVYRITTWGKTKLVYSVPLARYTGKKWDGVWRLISFDIPEKEAKQRKWLRGKLKELGFGMLQESLWVIPHDLGQAFEEFIEHENLKDYIIVWEGKRIFGEDEKELAKRVWKLDNLAEKYFHFINKWQGFIKDEGEVKKRKGGWEEEYFSLLENDPGLPKELLPENWPFKKARQLFLTFRKQI